jgi:hypothetical protein
MLEQNAKYTLSLFIPSGAFLLAFTFSNYIKLSPHHKLGMIKSFYNELIEVAAGGFLGD